MFVNTVAHFFLALYAFIKHLTYDFKNHFNFYTFDDTAHFFVVIEILGVFLSFITIIAALIY